MKSFEEVIDFWFNELEPQQWFFQNDDVDQLIIERFTTLYNEAIAGNLQSWADDPDGALALVIILDQFPRNMFRQSGQSFAFDHKAREAARLAINKGFDFKLPSEKRIFIYMPFMHSEELSDQDYCVQLIAERMGEKGKLNLIHAKAHRYVIESFGRFPFRNDAIGRDSTREEIAWLKEGAYQSAVKLFEDQSANE
ncbi:MAG: DUF924 domain-containing protein [Rhodobacteraceae bacterium]|nr:DUF924 domain-containing protein [Paracoccaceae bacterium]